MTTFQLCVSPRKFTDKVTAVRNTIYELKQFDLTPDNNALRAIFNSRTYSTNVFSNGQRSGDNYIGMTGLCLDFDHGTDIGWAERQFADFSHIIHTTSSHQAINSSHPIAEDCFRVILPFRPKDTHYFPDKDDADAVFSYVKELVPNVDAKTLNRGNHFVGFFGDDDSKYIIKINALDRYYDEFLTDKAIAGHRVKEAEAKVLKPKVSVTTFSSKKIITPETPVRLITQKSGETTTIKDLKRLIPDAPKKKMVCFCPFCNDEESATASAFAALTEAGTLYIHCSSCASRKVEWSWSGTYFERTSALRDENNGEEIVGVYRQAIAAPRFYHMVIKKADGRYKMEVCLADTVIKLGCDPKTLPVLNELGIHPGEPDGELGVQLNGAMKFNAFLRPPACPREYEIIPISQRTLKPADALELLKTKCPATYAQMVNICGKAADGTDTPIEFVLGWIAELLMMKGRMETMIVHIGKEGTGKSHFWLNIIGKGILGEELTVEANPITDQFTSEKAARSILHVMDDMIISKDNEEQLKNLITQTSISINIKNKRIYEIPNMRGYVLNANNYGNVTIRNGSRRFIVLNNPQGMKVPELAKSIGMTEQEMSEKMEQELPELAKILFNLEYSSYNNIFVNFKTEAREQVEMATEDAATKFMNMLKNPESHYWQDFKDGILAGNTFNLEKQVTKCCMKIGLGPSENADMEDKLDQLLIVCKEKNALFSFFFNDSACKRAFGVDTNVIKHQISKSLQYAQEFDPDKSVRIKIGNSPGNGSEVCSMKGLKGKN